MAGSTQLLEDPDHRVTDTVDLREKRLGNDCYAHVTTVSAPPVDKVADRHTRREI